MVIHFFKLPDGRQRIEVRNRNGPDVVLHVHETNASIPHDLAHAAVESALGLDDGFWAAIAAGATFEGFEPLEPSRHRTSGLKAFRSRGEATQRAELAVSWAHRSWSGQRTEGRGLGPCPLSPAELEKAHAALDRAKALWDQTRDGEALVWRW